MREIKFRAWDKLEKRMRKVVSLHWRDGKLISAKLEGENESVPIEGRLVIEQSTGLKDKKGVEIYEGDVCAFKSGKNTYKGVSKWDSSLAGFGLQVFFDELNRLYTFYELSIMGIDLDMLEVVGNIHENPELLEEK